MITDQAAIDRLQQEWIVEWVRKSKHALHVGCGEKYIDLPGCVNIDISPDYRIHADVKANACHLSEFFAPGEFDCIVSSHVLPSLSSLGMALREMATVLAPGGVMAHVIPDWRYTPQRKDIRRVYEYQPQGWYGPEEFKPVMAGVADLFEVVELENFAEFNWSFKIVATRRA